MKNSSIMMDDDDFTSFPVAELMKGVQVYRVNGFWLRPEYVEATRAISRHFKPLPTDIILTSFPKTGTTWLKSFVYSIVNYSSTDSLLEKNPHDIFPVLEAQLYGPTAEPHEKFPAFNSSPRIMSTHLSHQTLVHALGPLDCRIVYIARNPKDTLVSMWQFIPKSNRSLSSWPLEKAVKQFCDGEVSCGPYYDHVLGYREESLKNPNKVFFVAYEDLKINCKAELKRLAEFLECPIDKEEVLDEIVDKCSFNKMKNYEGNKSSEYKVSWLKYPSNSFFRQGDVGDHKNFLTEEMINHVDKITKEKFHGSGFIYGI